LTIHSLYGILILVSDLFKQLSSITEKKPLSKDYIEAKYIGNYMVIRWLSFITCGDEYSKKIIPFLNKLNKYNFRDKYSAYLYLYHTFPNLGKVNYSYIKKVKLKSDTALYTESLEFLADALELSVRETKYLVNEGYIDIDKIKHTLK